LTELDRLAKARADFAFESTLSGLGYLGRLQKWKVAGRVKQGGHDVPRADVLRRFARGWRNFEASYKPLADAWAVYDNSGDQPQLLETKR
jgi:predicted ABC-type ATPase